MKVENNNVILSNREYFTSFCVFRGNDLCHIHRMWLRWLDKSIGRDAPMWAKEEEYENFMNADFDRNEWNATQCRV